MYTWSYNVDGGSSIGWLHTWTAGKHDRMQRDMSVMISAEMYTEFIVPELEEQCGWLVYPLYHFDGIEQIRHLDVLLSIDRLKAVQRTCAAGRPSPLEYMPVLRQIQESGKSLVIWVSPEKFAPMPEQLSSKGLYLLVNVSSAEKAKELEKLSQKLTHK